MFLILIYLSFDDFIFVIDVVYVVLFSEFSWIIKKISEAKIVGQRYNFTIFVRVFERERKQTSLDCVPALTKWMLHSSWLEWGQYLTTDLYLTVHLCLVFHSLGVCVCLCVCLFCLLGVRVGDWITSNVYPTTSTSNHKPFKPISKF